MVIVFTPSGRILVFSPISCKTGSKWKSHLIRASKRPQNGTYHCRGGFLKEILAPLMQWFLGLREIGVPVYIRVMVLKAGVLDPEFSQKFSQKLLSPRYQALQRLLKANCITIQARTLVSHQNPQEMHDEALTFIQYMRPQLSTLNLDQDYVRRPTFRWHQDPL